MNPEDRYSADYETARARFREKAGAAGAALHTLTLPATGPGGCPLSIDIAWLGAPRPRRAFLHTSGLHGVEAFAGSAVQLALLDALPAHAASDALILVHVLNPYGMAWLRRTNENNVDLNRNFLVRGERWSGAPELYRALDPLLNPPSPPRADAFGIRAASSVLRHGFDRVKQAVAEGQYDYPRGLFFGGRELERGPQLYLEWLVRHLADASYVFALDLHTGLGKHGTDTVAAERSNATASAQLGAALGRTFIDPSGPSVAYTVRGGYGAALAHVLSRAKIDFVLQEIGTYPPVRVIHALREENRWHFFGDGSIVHPAKQRLREALCPQSTAWRRRAVELALELAHAGARWTFDRP